MSSKRRHYPQAQYQVNQAQSPAVPAGQQFGSQQPVAGYQGYGAAPIQAEPSYGVPTGPAAAAGGYFPPAGAATNGYGAGPAAVDQAAQGLNNLHLGANPIDNQSPYGQPQQPAYGGIQPSYGGVSQFESVAPSTPLNQLYQTDLLRELPPPIGDLSLPPPPLIIPGNLTAIPNNPNANAGPEYIRSTLNAIPTTSSLLKKSKLPFALVVRPYISLKDEDKPLPLITDAVIARCRRCRTYINSFVQFTEQGKRWRCNLCNLQNDVPQAFDYNNNLGAPVNRNERNELNYSVVEFIAPTEYMVRPPQPLIYVFVIDVSVNSIKTGLLATVATTILESLDRIPNKDERTKVAFIGVDSALHYFSIPEDSEPGESSIIVVPDIEEPFTPSPDSLLVNITNARQNIEKLLANLGSYFATNNNPGFALGPALKSAHYLVQSLGAKIVAFGSTLPNLGVGKLAIRDEGSVADKKNEASTLLSAQDSFYKSFAVECNKSQVTIEFFLTGSSYQDIATLANLPRFTAGQTHYYPAWSATSIEDAVKLSKELSNTISSDIALEAVLRTRGSGGLRMNAFYGNFFNRSSDLCSFPTFPRDQSYVIEISIEENINKPVVYLQSAVLHTTSFGERRIRVITLAIPTTSNISEVFASADQLAITNFYVQKAVEKVFSSSLIDARDLLSKYLTEILSVFKKEVIAGNVGGSSPLMLSTNLRMLPLLLHALTKHIGLRSGKVPADHRANGLNLLGSLPLPQLIKYIYPSVYSLHDIADDVGLPNEETGEIVLPTAINSSAESFERYGLYLIDNTSELFLWVGGDAVPDLVNDVFGTENIFQVQIGKSELPILENDFNIRVRNIISKIREGIDTEIYQNIYVVRGGSANEPLNAENAREIASLRLWAASNLVEDRINALPSYREFLSSLKDKISV